MNKFGAEKFCMMGFHLGSMTQVLRDMERAVETGVPVGVSAPELNSKAIARTIYRLQILSEEIGLIQSGKSANRLLGHLGRKTAIRRGLTSSELRLKLLDLTELIQSEMETQLFLWVPPARADAYTQNEPFFGASVGSRFPSCSIDIEETGKCFACNRHTAAVMHCMRVLEHGLRALCLALDLPFGERTWHRSLDAIEKRISVLDSQVKQKSAWKIKRQFYAEAAAEFKHFKDAWRNHAAHGREHYDEERADKIIEHTRSFMRVLSTRLKEKKP